MLRRCRFGMLRRRRFGILYSRRWCEDRHIAEQQWDSTYGVFDRTPNLERSSGTVSRRMRFLCKGFSSYLFRACIVFPTCFEDDRSKGAIGFRVLMTTLFELLRNHFSYTTLSESVAIPRKLSGMLLKTFLWTGNSGHFKKWLEGFNSLGMRINPKVTVP